MFVDYPLKGKISASWSKGKSFKIFSVKRNLWLRKIGVCASKKDADEFDFAEALLRSSCLEDLRFYYGDEEEINQKKESTEDIISDTRIKFDSY